MLAQLERRLGLTSGVMEAILTPVVVRQLQITLSKRLFILSSILVDETQQVNVNFCCAHRLIFAVDRPETAESGIDKQTEA